MAVHSANIAFLKSLGVWSLCTCVPVFLIVLRDGKWRINGDQFVVLFLVSLLPLLGTLLLFFWVGDREHVWQSVLYGLALGFAIPVSGGLLLYGVTSGFESPAILAGAAFLGPSSSIGGAIAGWIQGRWNAARKETHGDPAATSQ